MSSEAFLAAMGFSEAELAPPDDRFDPLDFQGRILDRRLFGNSHVTKTQLIRLDMAQLSDRQLHGDDLPNKPYTNKLENTLYYRRGDRQLVHASGVSPGRHMLWILR